MTMSSCAHVTSDIVWHYWYHRQNYSSTTKNLLLV